MYHGTIMYGKGVFKVSNKQSSIYLEESEKDLIKLLLIEKKGRWKTMSDFIREAVKEKLEKEGKK